MVEIAVQSSSDLFLKRKRVLVYGAPKVGKTICGLTISEQAPVELASGKPPKKFTTLEDTLLLNFDEQGMESCEPLNLAVPTIDLSPYSYAARMQDKGRLAEFNVALDKAFEQIYDRVAKGITKAVIIDPVSTLNVIFVGYHTSIADDGNKERIYEGVLDKHMRVTAMIRALQCDYVILAHAQAKFIRNSRTDPTQGKNAEIRGQADSMGGEFEEIQPEVSGKGAGLYKKATSIQTAIFKKLGKDGQPDRRYLMPNGGQNSEGGHRYADLLDREEPAHLDMMFKKLRERVAKRKAA